MPRYKPVQRNGLFIPVMLDEQIQPGTFEFALQHLVDVELDLTVLDARFRNDATGASAYDPRVMLKIVLLAYSRGLITSRKIEAACELNVLFMAVSGDARPSYTHIAKFVRELGADIQPLFAQVLMTCDRLGLIGLYSRRIATVEPVFANIRHHKGMSRFTLRGKTKVATQWQLYCLVHNIEKIATQAMRAA